MLLERRGNLHIHTTLSDGTGSHEDIASAARRAGLDWVIVTDHNAYAAREQAWRDGVLLLVGEELHDPAHPLRNHLLVFGAERDLAHWAGDTGAAIAAAKRAGGRCFIAHPYEHAGDYTDEPEINWESWELANGVHGLELWNYMSEFKARLPNAAVALLLAFWPKAGIQGPFPETLARWDALLAERPCVGIGGSDAHATQYSLGPIQRRVFSYEHLFGAVNTHALIEAEWQGHPTIDGQRVLESLAMGRCFVAYDALHEADGFRVTLRTPDGERQAMGAQTSLVHGAALVASTPARARLELWHDGQMVSRRMGRELSWPIQQPGVYRIVAYRRYACRWRTWILSNPLRVEPS